MNRFIIQSLTVWVLLLATPLGIRAADVPAPATVKSFDDYLIQANGLFKQGKPEEALAAIEAAQKLDPKRYEAPATAALILHSAGKAAEAKGALDAAMKLAPAEKQEKLQGIAKLLGGTPVTGASPTNSTTAPNALTGPARRQLGTLMLIIEEADKAKLDTERKKLLGEFLEKSEPFLKDNPNHLPVWTLRAVAALELNQPKPGWEAGQQLTKFGADNSEDPKVQKVMAMLDRKGWLSKEAPAEPSSATKENPFVNSLGMKFVPVPGTKVLFCIWETRVQDFEAFVKATGHDAVTKTFFPERDDGKGGKGAWVSDSYGAPMRSNPSRTIVSGQYSWMNPAFTQNSTHPVCGMCWDDTQAFCHWLSEKDGQKYRLPTDAEWSLAVGLSDEEIGSPKDKSQMIKRVYPWGSQWPPPNGAGNYAGSEARDADWPPPNTIDGFRDSYVRTSPVGSFSANRYGLFDLSGNVAEWCEDEFSPSTLKGGHVLRGGSWYSGYEPYLLSSARDVGHRTRREDTCGFRVVLMGGESR